MNPAKLIVSTGILLLFGVTWLVVLARPAAPPSGPDNGGRPATVTVLHTDLTRPGTRLAVEAETCTVIEAPMAVIPDTAASGGACLTVPQGAGKPPDTGGRAVCTFTVSAPGAYRLWGRRWWMDACGNSISLRISGVRPAVLERPTTPAADAGQLHTFGDDASYNPVLGLPWKWTRGDVYRLEAGTYTLEIHNREDGIRLDQFLFVKQDGPGGEYVPFEIEVSHGTE